MSTAPTNDLAQRRPSDEPGIDTGFEWMIEAFDCDVDRLRSLQTLQSVCDQVVEDLKLRVLGEPLKHQFAEPGGVTLLYMLSESHLACHTYPEYGLATFNLYCCRARPAWDWQNQLQKILCAESVETRRFTRGRRLGSECFEGEQDGIIQCEGTP